MHQSLQELAATGATGHSLSFCVGCEPFVFGNPFEKNPMNMDQLFECQMKGFLIGNPFWNWKPFQKRFTKCVWRHPLLPTNLGTDCCEPFCLWSHFPQRVPNHGPFYGLIFFAVLWHKRPKFKNWFRKSCEPPIWRMVCPLHVALWQVPIWSTMRGGGRRTDLHAKLLTPVFDYSIDSVVQDGGTQYGYRRQ